MTVPFINSPPIISKGLVAPLAFVFFCNGVGSDSLIQIAGWRRTGTSKLLLRGLYDAAPGQSRSWHYQLDPAIELGA